MKLVVVVCLLLSALTHSFVVRGDDILSTETSQNETSKQKNLGPFYEFDDAGSLVGIKFPEPICFEKDTSDDDIVLYFWPILLPFLDLTSADEFDLHRTVVASRRDALGFQLRLERKHQGIPVMNDGVVFYVRYGDEPAYVLDSQDSENRNLILRQSSNDMACISRIRLLLSTIDDDPEGSGDTLSIDDAKAIALLKFEESGEATTRVKPGTAELVFKRTLGKAHLLWRVELQAEDTEFMTLFLDAVTGEELDREIPHNAVAKLKASNPHEALPKISRNFPYVDAFVGVVCENGVDEVNGSITEPCEVYRGDPNWYFDSADYHGVFANPGEYVIFDTRLQNSMDLGTLNPLHQLGCNNGTNQCGIFDENFLSWLTCQNAACNDWALRSGFSWPATSDFVNFDLPWYPAYDRSNTCGSAAYRGLVGSSAREGRRQEVMYHAARAQNYWSEWLDLTLPQTRVYVVASLFDGSNNCDSGVTFSAKTMSITCNLCSFLQQDLTFSGEAMSRSTINHEFGHVVDYVMHNGISSRSGETNLPRHNYNWDTKKNEWRFYNALTESIAIFNGTTAGAFEYADNSANHYGSARVAGYRYPDIYYCGPNVASYQRARVFIDPWLDYVLSSGPIAYRSLRDHWMDGDFANRSINLLDSGCINTFDYSGCLSTAYQNTFYRRLFDDSNPNGSTTATEYQLSYEAVRAWQRRIRDWDVGAVGEAQCNGAEAPMTNLDAGDDDYSPWFDDVTNVSWYAPFLPIETHGTMTAYGMEFGPFDSSPGTCRGTSAGASCKPLANDYYYDWDKFTFIGRAGQHYHIYTTAGSGALGGTDTVMQIRSSNDTVVATNDDCATADIPPYGTLFSCVSFQPTSTGIYRVAIRPFSAAVGSRARYVLHVELRGDDYPNSDAVAAPYPVGHLIDGKTDNSDVDAFYQTMMGSGDMYLWITNNSGRVKVSVKDDNGGIVVAEQCVDAGLFEVATGLGKGTYYLDIKPCYQGDANAWYSVWWWNTSTPGGSQTNASSLYDSEVPTPLATRALTGYVGSAGDKHFYRFYADRNEIYSIDAIGEQAGPVTIAVEPDRRETTPQNERLVVNTDGVNNWHTLADDEHSGMVGVGKRKLSSHLTFVAPWAGDYFIVVSAEESGSAYVLWTAGGLVFTDVPEEP